jgi:flagella basal body P-ring formation protein FlgA
MIEITPTLLHGWRFAPLALPILLPLCDPAAKAGSITDPAAIDQAVAAFTGAAAGTPGGARGPADPRLQLAPCGAPLVVSWQGTTRSAVVVECPGPMSWRTFVMLMPQQGAFATGAARTAVGALAVKRGEAITLVVRGRGFSVQQPGEAVEGGAVGDWITVRTSRKGEPLRARIERPGLAVIPAG